MESNVSMPLSLTTVACQPMKLCVQRCVCMLDGAYFSCNNAKRKQKRTNEKKIYCRNATGLLFRFAHQKKRKKKLSVFAFLFALICFVPARSQRQTLWRMIAKIRRKKNLYNNYNNMNVFQSEVDMFLEIYLDSWDHKLNEKLLFIIFVYYFFFGNIFFRLAWVTHTHRLTLTTFPNSIYHDNP